MSLCMGMSVSSGCRSVFVCVWGGGLDVSGCVHVCFCPGFISLHGL